jgi:DNA-binding CsgD family transcriptional regulator
MAADVSSRARVRSSLSVLSKRELDVLEMTARGLTNRQVGTNLNVSVHAVKFHLASIYKKLNVSNRTEAAGVYFRAHAVEGMHDPA